MNPYIPIHASGGGGGGVGGIGGGEGGAGCVRTGLLTSIL
jgi:hypothetical protein